MANIKELIQSIESPDSSFDEKLAVINEMQDTLVAMKEHEQEAIDDNVELIIEALRTIEAKVEAKLRIIPEKGEQGIQGQKGEQGDRGLDGAQGKDGKSGIDGKDGLDGKDGVSVQDAKIDFDGSLVITLSDGREINVGEVVPVDVAQTIHKIQSGSGGDSQTTLNAIAALQATIATYGTMATQNANNVAITGGTINNTTIGATTPAAATFTTLTGNSTSQFGRSSANYLQAVGAASSSSPIFSVAGSDTNIDLNLTTKGAGGVNLNTGNGNVLRVADSGGTVVAGLAVFGGTSAQNTVYVTPYGSAGTANTVLASKGAGAVIFATNTSNSSTGTEQARISHTASAVNYVQVTGSATLTGAPTLSVQGSDANIPIRLQYKGNGGIQLSNAAGWAGLTVVTANNPNAFSMTGNASGTAPVLAATGVDTNIPLVLQPKGTGALQAQQTDSTATGGNARGANAVDWQTARANGSNVASGSQSVLTGGSGNTVSGFNATLSGGFQNNASGTFAYLGAGSNNQASATYGNVLGGNANTASGQNSSITGGQFNTVAGFYNFIGGGFTNSATSGSAVTTQSGTMNATTAVTLSGSNASIKVGQYITGTSIASDTYVAAISGTSLTLSKVASGSSTSTLSFYTPHGVVVGGGNNQATGSYSFIGGGGDAGTAANRNVASGDWSVVVGGRVNTASGVQSVVGGGSGNTSSSTYSCVLGGINNFATAFGSAVLGGYNNSASGNYSTTLAGQFGSTRSIAGNLVSSIAGLYSSLGNAQLAFLVLAKQTTDATATVITSDGNAAGTTNQVILPNNSAYAFRGTVIANVTGGGNTKAWAIEGAIKRGANAASTALVGTPTVTSGYADAGASTWAITATADTTNGGLAITFTGQASTTIRCVAKLETTEVTF